MKRQFFISLGAMALLVFLLAAQPALCGQNPVPDSPQTAPWKPLSSAIYFQQAEQVQREVQAELAKAQAEISRALQEVKSKAAGQHKEIAAKLAAHRGAMLAELQARQAELAALAQEKVHRGVAPHFAFEDSESGWLGVQIADVDAQKVKELKLPAERGVLITDVEQDSPAAKAGLKVNDVVTEFNGQRIESATQFRRVVGESLSGRAAQLTVWRDGRAQTLSATLGGSRDRIERSFTLMGPRDFNFNFAIPEIDVLTASRTPILGISAEDVSGQLGAYFGAPGGEGILVREVNSGSPAEKAGMKAGDVIIKIDGDRVRSLDELREKLRGRGSAAPSAANREPKGSDTAPSAVKSVSVGVIRKGAEVSLNVEIEQPRPAERRRITRRSAL